MSKLHCFVHKDYNGTTMPNISCKVCCKIYVDTLAEENRDKECDIADRKSRQKLILEKRIARKSGTKDVSWI